MEDIFKHYFQLIDKFQWLFIIILILNHILKIPLVCKQVQLQLMHTMT